MALVASYFSFSRKVSSDLAFLKGQFSHIIKVVEDYRVLREAYLLQGKDLEKAKADINGAFSKIRSITDGPRQ